jgi:hypothetical protein
VIPWRPEYDLTSATVRMIFRPDALPLNNSYGYDANSRQFWWDSSNNSAWALFSRDAMHQNEPGHFSAFLLGDGAVFVRYQIWSNLANYDAQYAGTNFFLFAPPGSVQAGTTYDMQVTFDHEQRKLELYLNGQLMDSRTDVPITLAGNREYWQLGGSGVHKVSGTFTPATWERTWFCGMIHHFEIWEGAYSAREVELLSCGIETGTEQWYEFFYVNFGRYPLPDEGIPASANAAQCNSDPNPPPTPPAPPPSDPCEPQILFLDRNNVTVPFWVNTDNFVVGNYVTFNNIGQTAAGEPIAGRVTMTSRSHPDLRIRMVQANGTFMLDAQGRADLSGQTAEFTLDFINQNTGAPVTHTGTITFSDIDRVTDSNGPAAEVVGMMTVDFISFHRAPATTVQQGVSGGYTTFTGTVDTVGSDRNAWATGMFHDRDQLRFRLNARNFNTGYGLTQQSVTCGVPPAPEPTCTATTLANQNFEMSATDNWSIPRTAHASALSRFLGRFAGNETVTWSRTLPADTNRLLIDFDLNIIDSWDGIGQGWSGALGDRLDLLVNNQLVGYKHFRSGDANYRQPMQYQANVGGADYVINMTPIQHSTDLGFTFYVDERWSVSISVTNPPSTFNMSFMSRTDESVDNESWGLDNFHVRTSCDTTPAAATPTHVVTTNIPYWWGDTFENWFTRPTSIPSGDWNLRSFSITGGGNVQARDGAGTWTNSGDLGWDGVQLRLATPAHGTTTTALLTRGQYLIQYNFVRAANP